MEQIHARLTAIEERIEALASATLERAGVVADAERQAGMATALLHLAGSLAELGSVTDMAPSVSQW